MLGRLVKTPRWQQAHDMDYLFTGQVNRALPIPLMLEPFLRWAREKVDVALTRNVETPTASEKVRRGGHNWPIPAADVVGAIWGSRP